MGTLIRVSSKKCIHATAVASYILQRRAFYILVFSFFFFTACQKEPIVTDKDYQTLGTSAHDFLSGAAYTALLVEVDYMPGYAPDATALNNLKIFLSTCLNKPEGISIYTQQIPSSGKAVLSIQDIVSIEKRYRTAYPWGNTLAVHILITDADFAESNVFATSYWNTSICLFGKKIQANAGGAGQVSRTQLYSTLMEHEFGHLMGLVNQGTPMLTNHSDSANGAHCNNPLCLMYYEVETTVVSSTTTSTIPSLDENCIADLKANGGK